MKMKRKETKLLFHNCSLEWVYKIGIRIPKRPSSGEFTYVHNANREDFAISTNFKLTILKVHCQMGRKKENL